MKKTSPLLKLPGFLLLVLFSLVALPANAQSVLPSVSGKVADENGQALPGNFLQVIPKAVNDVFTTRVPQARNRYFPIPPDEINANPKLEQNPDWK